MSKSRGGSSKSHTEYHTTNHDDDVMADNGAIVLGSNSSINMRSLDDGTQGLLDQAMTMQYATMENFGELVAGLMGAEGAMTSANPVIESSGGANAAANVKAQATLTDAKTRNAALWGAGGLLLIGAGVGIAKSIKNRKEG